MSSYLLEKSPQITELFRANKLEFNDEEWEVLVGWFDIFNLSTATEADKLEALQEICYVMSRVIDISAINQD